MNPARDAAIVIIIIIGLAMVSSAVRNVSNVNPNVLGTNEVPTYNPPEQTPKKVDILTEKEEQAKIDTEIAKVQASLAQIKKELEQIEKYGESSPYKGMITIRKSTGPLRATNVDSEYIQLDASNKNESNVVITNWKLKSTITGRSVSIPKGVYLIFPQSSGSELPITLEPGDKAYITTGRSPVGPSFKVNKCSGYYTQFQTFIPRISQKCPLPKEEILFYTQDPNIFTNNACMDFVNRMQRCKIPTKALPLALSYTCQEAIIGEINYGSCIDKHKDDSDFRIPEWRIYLKHNTELWRDKREIIKLLDENGKTVDYYSY